MSPIFEKKVLINAGPPIVWKALTEPAQMVQWMGEPEMGLTIENFTTGVIYQHLCFYWRTTIEKIRQFVEMGLISQVLGK